MHGSLNRQPRRPGFRRQENTVGELKSAEPAGGDSGLPSLGSSGGGGSGGGAVASPGLGVGPLPARPARATRPVAAEDSGRQPASSDGSATARARAWLASPGLTAGSAPWSCGQLDGRLKSESSEPTPQHRARCGGTGSRPGPPSTSSRPAAYRRRLDRQGTTRRSPPTIRGIGEEDRRKIRHNRQDLPSPHFSPSQDHAFAWSMAS